MDFKTVLYKVSAIVMGFVTFTEAGCTQSKTCDDDTNSDSWRSVTLEYANRQATPLQATNKGTTFVSKLGEVMTVESFKGQSLPDELNLWVKGLLEEHTALWAADYEYLDWTSDERWMACMEDETHLLIVRGSSRNPIAFAHFRFEIHPDSQYEILFISDVVIEKSMSDHGILLHIIDTVTEIATEFNMRKVMVTLFKEDKETIAQYKSRGFRRDNKNINYDNFKVYSKFTAIQEQELD